jgi:hypothetical protein
LFLKALDGTTEKVLKDLVSTQSEPQRLKAALMLGRLWHDRGRALPTLLQEVSFFASSEVEHFPNLASYPSSLVMMNSGFISKLL